VFEFFRCHVVPFERALDDGGVGGAADTRSATAAAARSLNRPEVGPSRRSP